MNSFLPTTALAKLFADAIRVVYIQAEDCNKVTVGIHVVQGKIAAAGRLSHTDMLYNSILVAQLFVKLFLCRYLKSEDEDE